jgi:carbonic anhydrase
LAVFGIFLEPADGNFADLFDSWDIGSPKSTFINLPEINTPDHVFHYKGSLTTPSCN